MLDHITQNGMSRSLTTTAATEYLIEHKIALFVVGELETILHHIRAVLVLAEIHDIAKHVAHHRLLDLLALIASAMKRQLENMLNDIVAILTLTQMQQILSRHHLAQHALIVVIAVVIDNILHNATTKDMAAVKRNIGVDAINDKLNMRNVQFEGDNLLHHMIRIGTNNAIMNHCKSIFIIISIIALATSATCTIGGTRSSSQLSQLGNECLRLAQ
mmetsp:Transcript_21207/g.34066  ORF Transcript_21207/g.34066 Transcript_21207/m.34066 type:complete len:216 (+) Transcript_21207:1707-2354(+)